MASATPERPRLTLFAGPNGAGKSTAYQRFVAAGYDAGVYLNADDVRRTLPDESGADLRAGRQVVERARALIAARQTFSRETTLAGGEVVRSVGAAIDAGFRVALVFVGVESVSAAQCRVAVRVASGGHDIPLATQQRRFGRCFDNAARVAHMAAVAYFLDNGGSVHRLVASARQGVVRFRDAGELDWVAKATHGLRQGQRVPRWLALADLRRSEGLDETLEVREQPAAL